MAGLSRSMSEALERCCSPSHPGRADFKESKSRDYSAGYCPLRWPLPLCCFNDALILALFFSADTVHMFCLGRRTPLARLGHLFRPPRDHHQRQSKTSVRRGARASPCLGIGTLPPLALPRRLYSRHTCLLTPLIDVVLSN